MYNRKLWQYFTIAVVITLFLGTAVAAQKGKSSHKKKSVHPIVCDNMLLGGSRGGRWLSSKTAARSVRGGEHYQICTLTGHGGQTTGGKASTNGSATGTQMMVRLKNDNSDILAVCADWNVRPRPVQVITSPRPEDIAVVQSLLKSHGISKAKIHIGQVVKADLLGDGSQEVLIAATTSRPGFNDMMKSQHDDYSFVVLVRPGGKPAVFVGAAYFAAHVPPSGYGPVKYEVGGVADLNGDGKMEIIIKESVYEGGGTAVYSAVGKTFKLVLDAGDGV